MDNTNTKIGPSLHDRFAGWILDHRRGFLTFIAVVLVTAVAWGINQGLQAKKDSERLDKIFAFQEKNMPAWEEGTLSSTDFAAAYQQLRQEVGPFAGLYPFALAVSDELLTKGAMQEAATILEDAMKHYVRRDPYRRYLVASRLATVYENLGQDQKAISVLESLDAGRTKLLPDKVKLDLGRLYRKIDPAKARSYFSAVADNSEVAELSRIAKLYLQNLEESLTAVAPRSVQP
ncbi:MAG: hypothetical protein J6Y94_00875 [Bacteriovoracaceae bacterium]|nr:hypothetical protein [Bacteriovoracaceae bacterium]